MKNSMLAHSHHAIEVNRLKFFDNPKHGGSSVRFWKLSATIVATFLCAFSVSCSPKHDSDMGRDELATHVGKGTVDKKNSIPEMNAQTRESEVPTLTIGSKAPSIDIANWISLGKERFKPITNFEAGKVYVVEFWATWCGPCVASMPHLAETQERYADDVQIISISDEDMATIDQFLDREVGGTKHSEKEVARDESNTGESADKTANKTFRELTSAYCLTSDPDRSVSRDYMEAAGQNGIPTCFIVGKTGEIEWIGHPMSMDGPLSKIVDGSWDRANYLDEFKKSQDRDLLMTTIMQDLRQGDHDGAMKKIEEAKKNAEGDPETLTMLDQMRLNVVVTPAMNKVRAGDIEGGLVMLDEISKSLTPDQQALLGSVELRLSMQAKNFVAAERSLKKMTDVEKVDAQLLNAAAWDIYEAAKDDSDFSKSLLDAALMGAEKAVATAPNDGSIMDTLAHLYHLKGDLERAIELETQAMEKAGPSKSEIQAYLDQLKQEKAGK